MSSSIFRRFSSSARLGDLLVQAGILTPAQLSEVVKNSRTKKLQIGQVLVMSNLLTPKDLQIVLEAQSMLRDKTIDLNLAVQCIKVARKIGANFSDVLEDYDQSAAQRARTGKLGELFSDAGVISQEDLSEAMERSVNTGMPLGRMLVLNKTISSEVLQKGLDVQLRLRDELITREEALLELRRAAGMSDEIADTPAPVEEKKQPIVRLGELLVMAGILNETDVMDALEWGLANQQPIGNVLVSQELISKELLDAALFFQQATRDGKIDSMKACECLSEVFSTGVSPEEALAEAEPTKPREELKVAPITYQQLVTMSRVVTEEDIERAFDQERHSAAFIGKVLVLTGIMDVPTLQSTLRCYQMVAKGWLTVDDAIAALDYCLHQNPTAPLSFEQALRDLQWTMETGLTMRGERATVSSTKLDAIRPTKKTPPPEPVLEEAPAAPADEDEEEPVAEEAAESEEEAAEQPEEEAAEEAEKEEAESPEEEKEEAPAAPEEEEEQEEPAESSSKEDEEPELEPKDEMPLDEEFATEEEELAPAAPDEEESEELEAVEEPEVNEEEAAESTAEEEEEESEEIKVKEAELVAAKREAEPVAAKAESKSSSKGDSESPKSDSKGAGKGPINSEGDDDDDEPSLSDALRGLYDEEPEQGKDNGAQKEEAAEVTEPDDRSSSTGGLKALLKGLASNPDEESPEVEPSKADEKSKEDELKSIKEEALSKAEKAAAVAKAEKEEAKAKEEAAKEEAAAKAKEEATAKSEKESKAEKAEPPAKGAPKSDMAAKIREQAEALAKVDSKKDEKEKADKAESKKEPAEKEDSKEGKTKSAKVQKELAEIEDIAGMSAEQLLAQIMKTATNPEAAAQVAKRGGRFSETILPEDAKARQLAKLVGNQASKELTERLSFEKQDENAEALDTAFARLAETYFEQGNYKEAQVIYERMLVHRLNDLGPDNPLLVEDYNNLAMTLCVQGRFDKAEPFMKRAVHLYESEPNRDAVEHADYLHSLGTILYKLEKFKDAEEVMLKVVQLRKDGLPEDHEDMGRALADYAKVLKKLGKADVADSIYKKAREILAKNS